MFFKRSENMSDIRCAEAFGKKVFLTHAIKLINQKWRVIDHKERLVYSWLFNSNSTPKRLCRFLNQG